MMGFFFVCDDRELSFQFLRLLTQRNLASSTTRAGRSRSHQTWKGPQEMGRTVAAHSSAADAVSLSARMASFYFLSP